MEGPTAYSAALVLEQAHGPRGMPSCLDITLHSVNNPNHVAYAPVELSPYLSSDDPASLWIRARKYESHRRKNCDEICCDSGKVF